MLRDSIKYLGCLVDKHRVTKDTEAIEALLTWNAPKTDTQLMSFLGFTNHYREFMKGYNDNIYPMQQLKKNKGRKISWTDDDQISSANIKREVCEAPVRQRKGFLCYTQPHQLRYRAFLTRNKSGTEGLFSEQ